MSALVDLRHFAKKLAFRLLPASVQEEIDFRFYVRRLRAGTQVPEHEFEILHHFVEPGTVALDVGANLGGYSVPLCDLVGRAGAVHAFEPVPRTYRLLKRCLEALGKSVQVHGVAVSDRDGETSFFIPLEGSLENFYVASLVRSDARTAEIRTRTVTLDTWHDTAGGPRVSFVKIDVEGVEFRALSGARSLITRHQPVILCEVSDVDEAEGPASDVFSLMRDLGYESFQYENGKLVARSSRLSRSGPNFVFIPASNVDRFAGLLAR